jgi:hypothetical protein
MALTRGQFLGYEFDTVTHRNSSHSYNLPNSSRVLMTKGMNSLPPPWPPSSRICSLVVVHRLCNCQAVDNGPLTSKRPLLVLFGHGAMSDLSPLCAPKRTPPTTTDLRVHAPVNRDKSRPSVGLITGSAGIDAPATLLGRADVVIE